MIRRITLIIIFSFRLFCVNAQDKREIDSLKQVINTATNDTTIIKTYLDIGYIYELILPDTALVYYQKALKIAESKELMQYTAKCNLYIGIVYFDRGSYLEALNHYQKALKINEELGNEKRIAVSLVNIAGVYDRQGNSSKALEYYHKALKIKRSLGITKGVTGITNNIGVVYYRQKNYTKALEYFFKALKINENTAIKALVSVNIGDVYNHQKNHPEALKYFLKGLKINEKLGNKNQIAISLVNIANLFNETKEYNKSLSYANKGMALIKGLSLLETERALYRCLSATYRGQRNYKKALYYKDKWIILNDSLYNTEKAKSIAEMYTKYETEKKEKQILKQQAELKTIQLKAEKEKAEKEKAKKDHWKIQRNMYIMALFLMIIFIVYILRSYNQNKKGKLLLETQKKELEVIHRELSESITYATRLQGAIFPTEKILKKHLSEHFVLFKPKDQVSGDFYWWSHTENHTIITAADCTGHGVPGAFMSLLGYSSLREIVQKEYITHTGLILRKLRHEIITALKQQGKMGDQKDGMDMAIISIDHETNIVQFSGANNPLYILTNRKLEGYEPLKDFENFYEIKADKMPIAIYDRMDDFTTHEIQLMKGDILYMFSDGYTDQFGGPKGKKLRSRPFKRLLSENRNKSLEEQKKLLNNAFMTWKGDLEQIDDVVVVGIKI